MNDPSRAKTSTGQWLALTAALLGWLFDGLEMGVFPLVGRPALRELLPNPAETEVWFGVITAVFLVGAATGGVLFGWLGDRLGRVRAMTLSVLVYAFFTGACGLAQSAEQIAVLRFIASLGMGGEWSLGVALVMELWPNRSRARLAGVIGAAANFGYMGIGWVGLGLSGIMDELGEGLTAAGLSAGLVERLTSNQGWRLLMLVGAAPALLSFFIRLFVPESERWQQHGRASSSNWAVRDLSGVAVGAAAAMGIVWLAASSVLPLPLRVIGTVVCVIIAAGGYLFPVVRYIDRSQRAETESALSARSVVNRMLLGAALSGVALLGTWASMQWAPSWADKLTGGVMPNAKSWTLISMSLGAIVGTILAALAGDWFGRRATYALMCLTSMASMLWVYQGHDAYDAGLLVAVFVGGLCTASFYGWLPLYLPELFPTRVRGTGQGFGFNFGRILAAIGTLQTGNLMALFAPPAAESLADQVAQTATSAAGYSQACSVMSAVYLVGLVLIFFAPETRGKPLPE